jgi:hypothetical protein
MEAFTRSPPTKREKGEEARERNRCSSKDIMTLFDRIVKSIGLFLFVGCIEAWAFELHGWGCKNAAHRPPAFFTFQLG